MRVRERKLPKWYWCDSGIVRAMKRVAGPTTPEEEGALFEGLVAQLLRAYQDYQGLCDHMCYWAPSDGAPQEVDFLLIRGSNKIAIEAKSGRTFSKSWCKGLRAIKPLPQLERRIIVYPRGPTLETEDGIEVMPFGQLASELAAGTLWVD